MRNESSSIRDILEKLDDFSEDELQTWAIMVGEDNKHRMIFNEIRDNMSKSVRNGNVNAAVIAKNKEGLLDVSNDIKSIRASENLKRFYGNVHVIRELMKLRELKVEVDYAISDLSTPNPNFDWV